MTDFDPEQPSEYVPQFSWWWAIGTLPLLALGSFYLLWRKRSAA
ncbi:MAG: hypothetical protein ACP5I8_15270 [Phycisphaerae bacterium]